MTPRPAPSATATDLLRFNHALLDQAVALAAAHDAPGAPPYAQPVGAHLRHVIEHYEALLQPAGPGEIDYDARARDARLEACPRTARQRLAAVQARLQHWQGLDPAAPLRVHGRAGLMGEFGFVVDSSVGRELAFVATHAVHHFALLKAHCLRQGLAVAEGFGVAPATRAHLSRCAGAATPPAPTEDPPCFALATTA